MTRLKVVVAIALVACLPGAGRGQVAGPARMGPVQPGGRQAAPPQGVRPAQAITPIAGQTPINTPLPIGQLQPTAPPGQFGPAAGAPASAVTPITIPTMPQAPAWVAQQKPEEQKWIDDVLRYWENHSEKIKLFECKFRRWDYDSGILDAAGKRHPRTYAEGAIKYGQPDKGLFKIEKLVSILPSEAGKPPQEVLQNPELGEHWICDGKQVFSFEANKKQVSVTPLPPEMRGKAIVDGPLPFMFGAKAETIRARYWIRDVRPPDSSGQYWLEAVPKSRTDAQNFKMVRIVLSEKEFLPELLTIYLPNYDPPRNDARQVYQFLERKTEDEQGLASRLKKNLDFLNLWHRDFSNPAIPLGWKKVELAGAGGAAPPPPGPTALPSVPGAPLPAAPAPTASQRQRAPLPR